MFQRIGVFKLKHCVTAKSSSHVLSLRFSVAAGIGNRLLQQVQAAANSIVAMHLTSGGGKPIVRTVTQRSSSGVSCDLSELRATNSRQQ